MAIYDGAAFTRWQEDLFIGAFVYQEVRRIKLAADKVLSEVPIFTGIAVSIRDIRAGLDDFLYILADSNSGKVTRVVPNL